MKRNIYRWSPSKKKEWLRIITKTTDRSKEQGYNSCSYCDGHGDTENYALFGELKVENHWYGECIVCKGTKKQAEPNEHDIKTTHKIKWYKDEKYATDFKDDSVKCNEFFIRCLHEESCDREFNFAKTKWD